MINLLVIDDKPKIWNSLGSDFKKSDIKLNVIEPGRTSVRLMQEMAAADLILIHDSLKMPGSSGELTVGQIIRNELKARPWEGEKFPVHLIDNSPEADLERAQRRWADLGLDAFFWVESLVAFPVREKKIKALVNHYEEEELDDQVLSTLPFPIRVIDDDKRRFSVNRLWTWEVTEPLPGVPSDGTEVVYTRRSEEVRYPHRLTESQIAPHKRVQTAVPFLAENVDSESGIISAFFNQVQGFGIKRLRYYHVWATSGGCSVLALRAVAGHNLDEKKPLPNHKHVYVGTEFGNRLSFWLDDETQQSIEALEAKLTEDDGELVVARSKGHFHGGVGSSWAAVAEYLEVGARCRTLNVPLYCRRTRKVRAIIVLDCGNTGLKAGVEPGVMRIAWRLLPLLESLAENLARDRRKDDDNVKAQAYEFVNRALVFDDVSAENSSIFLDEFLRECMKLGSFSLGALCWKTPETEQAQISNVILDESYDETEKMQIVERMLFHRLRPDIQPALAGAIKGSVTCFPYGLTNQNDLNGNRPRVGVPIQIGPDVQGAVAFSRSHSEPPILRRDVDRVTMFVKGVASSIFLYDALLARDLEQRLLDHELSSAVRFAQDFVKHLEEDKKIEFELLLPDFVLTDEMLGENLASKFDCSEVINQEIDRIAELAKNYSVEVIRRPREQSTRDVFSVGNVNVFRKCIRNLLRNAVLHSENPIYPDRDEVWVSEEVEDEKAIVRVLNKGEIKGAGLGPIVDYSLLAFDRHGSPRKSGVSILRELVARCGGSLDVANVEIDNGPSVEAVLRWPL
jgi:hypothetical protein